MKNECFLLWTLLLEPRKTSDSVYVFSVWMDMDMIGTKLNRYEIKHFFFIIYIYNEIPVRQLRAIKKLASSLSEMLKLLNILSYSTEVYTF